MQVVLSPVFFFISTVVGLLVAWVGDSRRIGSGWAFFFTFFWILPGVLLTISSPTLKKMPPPTKKDKNWDTGAGIMFLVFALLTLNQALSTPDYFEIQREDTKLYKIGLAVFLAGTGICFLTRYSRHVFAWKRKNNPPSQPPQEDPIETTGGPMTPDTPNYELAEKD